MITVVGINHRLEIIQKAIQELRNEGCKVYYDLNDNKLTIENNKDIYKIDI
jgi:hypothetical protein